MKKIPCGGFYIDDDTLEVNDNILKVKNGGSSGLIVETHLFEQDGMVYLDNATALFNAFEAVASDTKKAFGGGVIFHYIADDGGFTCQFICEGAMMQGGTSIVLAVSGWGEDAVREFRYTVLDETLEINGYDRGFDRTDITEDDMLLLQGVG